VEETHNVLAQIVMDYLELTQLPCPFGCGSPAARCMDVLERKPAGYQCGLNIKGFTPDMPFPHIDSNDAGDTRLIAFLRCRVQTSWAGVEPLTPSDEDWKWVKDLHLCAVDEMQRTDRDVEVCATKAGISPQEYVRRSDELRSRMVAAGMKVMTAPWRTRVDGIIASFQPERATFHNEE
jgi:hypothetical protein